MISLVGYTGFVGSNIYEKGKIDAIYNSQNIEEAFGTEPDLLIYAGLRAEKYLANSEPERDMELIYQAQDNIKRIAPKRLVLISTIDVFKKPIGVDESAWIDDVGLHAYGLNRYRLECWVRSNYSDSVIIRLPALFGKNIKKNFIYDFINVIPFMLKNKKFEELRREYPVIDKYYSIQDNGFYKCKNINQEQKQLLKQVFQQAGFTALNFTDSRSVFQFYPLSRLWDDIQVCIRENIEIFHPATEPVSAAEVYEYLVGEKFVNITDGVPVNYDYKTSYDKVFGGTNGYIMSKGQVLQEIKRFVESF